MRTVLFSTRGNALGGVFAKAYRAAEGPPLRAVVFLPEPKNQGNRLADRLAAAVKLASPRGTARLLAARLGFPLASDGAVGLDLRWPDAMLCPETETVELEDLKTPAAVSRLQALRPDLLISVGAPVIFNRRVLALPSLGAVNVHNGSLPKYRGHFGTFWEVYHGERWAYVCIHEMATKVDAGNLLAWQRIEIAGVPSFFDLLIAKKILGGTMLARFVRDIQRDGKLPAPCPIDPQGPATEGYFAYPSTREVLRLRWGRRRREPAIPAAKPK